MIRVAERAKAEKAMKSFVPLVESIMQAQEERERQVMAETAENRIRAFLAGQPPPSNAVPPIALTPEQVGKLVASTPIAGEDPATKAKAMESTAALTASLAASADQAVSKAVASGASAEEIERLKTRAVQAAEEAAQAKAANEAALAAANAARDLLAAKATASAAQIAAMEAEVKSLKEAAERAASAASGRVITAADMLKAEQTIAALKQKVSELEGRPLVSPGGGPDTVGTMNVDAAIKETNALAGSVYKSAAPKLQAAVAAKDIGAAGTVLMDALKQMAASQTKVEQELAVTSKEFDALKVKFADAKDELARAKAFIDKQANMPLPQLPEGATAEQKLQAQLAAANQQIAQLNAKLMADKPRTSVERAVLSAEERSAVNREKDLEAQLGFASKGAPPGGCCGGGVPALPPQSVVEDAVKKMLVAKAVEAGAMTAVEAEVERRKKEMQEVALREAEAAKMVGDADSRITEAQNRAKLADAEAQAAKDELKKLRQANEKLSETISEQARLSKEKDAALGGLIA